MPEPVTLLGMLALNIGCGIASDAAQALGRKGYGGVMAVLGKGSLPENHNILRATHAAHVTAMKGMAKACATLADSDSDVEKAAAKALKQLTREKAFCEFRFDGEHFPLDEANAAIDRMFAGGLGSIEGGSPAAEHRAYNRVIVADLATWGIDLPPLFDTLFVEGCEGHLPWHLAFRTCFADALDKDSSALNIFTVERLTELRGLGIVVIDALDDLHFNMLEGFESMRDGFEAASKERAELKAMMAEILGRQDGEIDAGQARLKKSRESRQADMIVLLGRLVEAQRPGAETASVEMLMAIASKFHDQRPDADLESLRAYLLDRIAEYHTFKQRLAELEADDNRGAALIADAEAAVEHGDFDRADALLAEAEALCDEKIARELIRKSKRRALRGDSAKLKGDFAAAIDHYDVAAAMLPENAEEERRSRLSSAAEVAREWGEQLNEPTALLESIERWRAVIASLNIETDSESWAITQNNLGHALRTLGERQEGTEALHEAVAAYRAALEVHTRERQPLEWAMTQNNLGNALRTLGERREGTEALDEAVAAYSAALEVQIRDRLPLDWAMAQNNLGNALLTLGQRREGTAVLDAAVIAFRAALEVYTRDRSPLQRAMTQNNLGNALKALGERRKGTEALDAAVAAYRAALEVHTRDHLPLQWAMTMENIGLTLIDKATALHDRPIAGEAVVAFEQALEVFAHPALEWNRAKAAKGLARAQALRDALSG